MPAKKEPKSYAEAVEELEEIASLLDDRNIDIDLLSEKVKRAHELVEFCQKRIESVRFEVENILEETEEDDD